MCKSYLVCICVGLLTHDMGLDTPLALDQDRRCRTLEAEQNTAEEGPHRVHCGDTASTEGKERQIYTFIEASKADTGGKKEFKTAHFLQ